jgi:cytochrome c oxidase assembly factor CtaG
MDPTTKAILASWDWRVEVMIVLALAGTFYTIGWWRLRRRQRYGSLATGWRLISYLFGLLVIGLALMSPIALLSQQLFLMHMTQHLLLIMIGPPLLLVTNPMPFILWGLPASWRLKVGGGIGRLLHRHSPVRRHLQMATSPGIVWLAWVIMVFGWHDPTLYNAALQYGWVHNIEHLSFFTAGLLFWWRVTGAGPRIHKQASLLGRIAFVIGAIPPNMLTGVVLAFASEPIYTYYLAVPRLWNLSVMADQQIGGVIMWVPGSMMYIIAALILISRLLDNEDKKPVLPEKRWGSDEAVAAPK